MKKLILVSTILLALLLYKSYGKTADILGKNLYINDIKTLGEEAIIKDSDSLICGLGGSFDFEFNEVHIHMHQLSKLNIQIGVKTEPKVTILKQITGKIDFKNRSSILLETPDKLLHIKNADVTVNVSENLTTVQVREGLVNIFHKTMDVFYHAGLHEIVEARNPIVSLQGRSRFNGVPYSERTVPAPAISRKIFLDSTKENIKNDKKDED